MSVKTVSKGKYTVESELFKALLRFSFGRLNAKQARELAARTVPVYVEESKKNELISHKGVTWFAKEILRVLKTG